MAKVFRSGFQRRTPDLLTEELVAVLSGKSSFEFKPLFELILQNLQSKKIAKSNTEMLRLRTYEKLQQLVEQGVVKKTITNDVKKYKGLESLTSMLPVVPEGA